MGKRKSLMKSIELREKRKRRREELEVVLFLCVSWLSTRYVCIFHLCLCIMLYSFCSTYWCWRLLLSTG